jgi:hypothetical protein
MCTSERKGKTKPDKLTVSRAQTEYRNKWKSLKGWQMRTSAETGLVDFAVPYRFVWLEVE